MSDPIKAIVGQMKAAGKVPDENKIVTKLSDPAFRKSYFEKKGESLGYKSYDDFEAALAPKVKGINDFNRPLDERISRKPLEPEKPFKPTFPPTPLTAKGQFEKERVERERKNKLPMYQGPGEKDKPEGGRDQSFAEYVGIFGSNKPKPIPFYEVPNEELLTNARGLTQDIDELEAYLKDFDNAPDTQNIDQRKRQEVETQLAGKIDQLTRLKGENPNELPIEWMTPKELLERTDTPQRKQINELKEGADQLDLLKKRRIASYDDYEALSAVQKTGLKQDPELYRYTAEAETYGLYLNELGRAANLTQSKITEKFGYDIWDTLKKAQEDPNSLTGKERYSLEQLASDSDYQRYADQMRFRDQWAERTVKLIEKYPTVKQTQKEGEMQQRAIDAVVRDHPVIGFAGDFSKKLVKGAVVNFYKAMTSNAATEYEEFAKSGLGIPTDNPYFVATSTKFQKPFTTKTEEFTDLNGKKLVAHYTTDGNFIGTFDKEHGLRVSTIDPGLYTKESKSQKNWTSGAAMGTEVLGDMAVTIALTRGLTNAAVFLKPGAAAATATQRARIARWIATPIASTVQYNNRWIQQSLQEGMTIDQATSYSLAVSAGIGLLQTIYPFEAQVSEKLFANMWKGVTPKDVAKYLTNPSTFWKKVTLVGKDVLGENVEENIEQGFEMYGANRLANEAFGTDLQTQYKDWQELKEALQETGFITTFATGPLSALTQVTDKSLNQTMMRKYLLAAAMDLDQYKATISELRSQGKLDNSKNYYEEELDAIKSRHGEAFASEEYTDEAKKDLIVLELQSQMEAQKAASAQDPNSTVAQKARDRYDEIQEEIKNTLSSKKGRSERDLKQIKKDRDVRMQQQSEQQERRKEKKEADQQEAAAKAEAAIPRHQTILDRIDRKQRGEVEPTPTPTDTRPFPTAEELFPMPTREAAAPEVGQTVQEDVQEQTDQNLRTQIGPNQFQENGEVFYEVPSSNGSDPTPVRLTEEKYQEWKALDDKEKADRELVQKSKTRSPEQKSKRLKEIAMTSAAAKRKVLGTLTALEQKKVDKELNTVQQGDSVMQGNVKFTVVNPSAYGKVQFRNEETGLVFTIDRDSEIVKDLIAQKKATKPVPAPSVAPSVAPPSPTSVEFTGASNPANETTPFRKRAANAAKFLAKLGFPVKIVVHSTQQSFYIATNNGQSAGIYKDGVIHLDESAAVEGKELNTRAIHEAWHPVIDYIRATNPDLYTKLTKFMTDEVKKNPSLNKKLGAFASRYVKANAAAIAEGKEAEHDVEEESLTEFLTQVSDNPNILTANGRKSLAKAIAQTFKAFAKYFVATDNRNIEELSNEAIMDIINAAARAFSGDMTNTKALDNLITNATLADFTKRPQLILSLRNWAVVPGTQPGGEQIMYNGAPATLFLNTPTAQASTLGTTVITPDGRMENGRMTPHAGITLNNPNTGLPTIQVGNTSISFVPQQISFRPKSSLLPTEEAAFPMAPTNTDQFANMTVDGNDFVFFHWSKAEREWIDPAFQGTGILPSDEARSIGTGAPTQMFYTEQGITEPGVGHVAHVVRVPMDQVYNFNNDPNNYFEEAKALHQKYNPGQAFNPNAQVAFITRVAADNGYLMTVAKWGQTSRAHTAVPLKVVESANTQEYKFVKNYPSNKSLGWKALTQPSKAELLGKMYEQISSSVGADYSNPLYKLRSMAWYGFEDSFAPFKSQEAITEAIMNSELPQSVKDNYQETLGATEQTSRSILTVPGNRLFNNPLVEATQIAQEYMAQAGLPYIKPTKITKLDTVRAKEIAKAYEAMKNDPNNPRVAEAYAAMGRETIDQFDVITGKGYQVEINNQEPYDSSQDMIDDLRTNKRMKIFSTESGFGDEPITDEQRAANPLLQESGRYDRNGVPLLINDVFRFVHDFFGHAELGNSFGPLGEENAWNVHANMFSPLARKAMTSETRGQNSWVNFSGVNEEVFVLRDKARKLRQEGKSEEAAALTQQVYEGMKFAEQKVGLLPDEYTINPYNQGAKSSLMPTEEVQAVPTFFPNAGLLAEEKNYKKGYVFKTELQKKFKEHLPQLKKRFGRDFDPSKYNPAVGKKVLTPKQEANVKEYLVSMIVEEAKLAVKAFPKALGWYETVLGDAMEVLSLLHPELKTDPKSAIAFKLALALTSNGIEVTANLFEAERQYNVFKETGRFDSTRGLGPQGNAVKTQFKFINYLLDQGLTLTEFHKFLTSKYRVGDLKAVYTNAVGKEEALSLVPGELVDQVVFGAAIFGPKIGNGFYMNLNGEYEQLTIDRWFMATWGRLTGGILKKNPKKLKKDIERLKGSLANLTKEERATLNELIPGYRKKPILEVASAITGKAYSRHLPTLQSTKGLDTVRKDGINVTETYEGIIIAPESKAQRPWIREVMAAAQERMHAEGIPISMADLQAALWYPEKALYDGAERGTVEEAIERQANNLPDYRTGAIKLVQKNGISNDRINDLLGGTNREATTGSSEELDPGYQESERGVEAVKELVLQTAQQSKTKNSLLADMSQVLYTGVYVNKEQLLQSFSPVHENVYAHHSTAEFKPKTLDGLPIGENKALRIKGRLTTPKVDVLLVENDLSKNQYPHITLSTSGNTKPFEANDEIKNNLDKVVPLDVIINGTVGVTTKSGDVLKAPTSKGKSSLLPDNQAGPKYSLLPEQEDILRDEIPNIRTLTTRDEKDGFIEGLANLWNVEPIAILVGLANHRVFWTYGGKNLNQTAKRALLGHNIPVVAEMFYDMSNSTALAQQMAEYAEVAMGWGSPDAVDFLFEEVDELNSDPKTRSAAMHLLNGMLQAALNTRSGIQIQQRIVAKQKELSSTAGQVQEAAKSAHNVLPSLHKILQQLGYEQALAAGATEAQINNIATATNEALAYNEDEVSQAVGMATRALKKDPHSKSMIDRALSAVRGIFSVFGGKSSLLNNFGAGTTHTTQIEAVADFMTEMVNDGKTGAQTVYATLKALQQVNEEYFQGQGTYLFASNEAILEFFRAALGVRMMIPGTNRRGTTLVGTYLNQTSPYQVDLTDLADILNYNVTAEEILKRLVEYVYSTNNVGGKTLAEMIMGSPFFSNYTTREALQIQEVVASHMQKTYGERVKSEIEQYVQNMVQEQYFGKDTVKFKALMRSNVEKIIDAYNYGILADDSLKALVAAMYLGDQNLIDTVNRLIELSVARAKTTSSIAHRKIDKEGSWLAFKANPAVLAKFFVNLFAYLINGLLSGVTTLYAATFASLFVTAPRIAARTAYMAGASLTDIFKGDWGISPFAFLVDFVKSGQMKELFKGIIPNLMRNDSRADHAGAFFGDSGLNTMGSIKTQTSIDRALSDGLTDIFSAVKAAKNRPSVATVGQAMLTTLSTIATAPLRVVSVLKAYEQAVASITVPYLAYTEALEQGRKQGLRSTELLEFARDKAGFGNIRAAHSAAMREMISMAAEPEFQHMFKLDAAGNPVISSSGMPVAKLRYADLFGSLVQDAMLRQADNDFTVLGEYIYKDMQMMGQPEGLRPATAIMGIARASKPNILQAPGKQTFGHTVTAATTAAFGYALLPFGRIIAQTISVSYRYSVFGAIHTAIKLMAGNKETFIGSRVAETIPLPFLGKALDGMVDTRIRSNAELWEQFLITAGAMVVFFGYFAMDMFDWDDDELKLNPDRNWDFTFTLTGSYRKNLLQDPSAKTLSFRTRNDDGTWGEWHSYKFAMLHIPFASVLGSIRDKLTYGENKLSAQEASYTMVSGPAMAITEQTFAMTINTMKNAAMEMTWGAKEEGDETAQAMGQILKTMTVDILARSMRTVASGGNFTRDIYADLTKAGYPGEGFTNSQVDNLSDEVLIAIFKDSPIFEKLILGDRDKVYDSFGNQVPREFKVKQLAEMFAQGMAGPIPLPLVNTPFGLSEVTKNLDLTPVEDEYLNLPEWRLISKYPRVSAPSKYKAPDIVQRGYDRLILKESTKKEMQMEVALIIRDYIRENYDGLDKLDEGDLTRYLKYISSDAVEVMKARREYWQQNIRPEIGTLDEYAARVIGDKENEYIDKIRLVEEQ